MGCNKSRMLSQLRKERKRLGITQVELSEILGVTPQYISALERGLNELTYYDAYKIARYMGQLPDSLFLDDAKERRNQEIQAWEEMDKQRLEKRKEDFERSWMESSKDLRQDEKK